MAIFELILNSPIRDQIMVQAKIIALVKYTFENTGL